MGSYDIVVIVGSQEAYIGGAAKLFDADGNLANETTREFLQGFANAFASWVAMHARALG